jgi:hypothetical protein
MHGRLVATCEYAVAISVNYDWTAGGKLPGVCSEGACRALQRGTSACAASLHIDAPRCRPCGWLLRACALNLCPYACMLQRDSALHSAPVDFLTLSNALPLVQTAPLGARPRASHSASA